MKIQPFARGVIVGALAMPQRSAQGTLAPVAVTDNVALPGPYNGRAISWSAGEGDRRTLFAVAPTRPDPNFDPGNPSYGGIIRQLEYLNQGRNLTLVGGEYSGHHGQNDAVMHYQNPDGTENSDSSRHHTGQWSMSLNLDDFKVLQYKYMYTLDQTPAKVGVTIEWLFATGVMHPIGSITIDASRVKPGTLASDSRWPYGEMPFADRRTGAALPVEGVRMGTSRKLATVQDANTTANGYNLDTSWRDDGPNTVPYVATYSTRANIETGLVGTTPQQDAGGGTNAPGSGGLDWPYQVNQYQLPAGTTRNLFSWGSPRQVGPQKQYSYSVSLVAGDYSQGPVSAQVGKVEASQQATLLALSGATVVAAGPSGPARRDFQTYQPAGYSPRGYWELSATSSHAPVKFSFQLSGNAVLEGPLVCISQWSGGTPTRVTLDNRTLVARDGYFAGVDKKQKVLWMQLPQAFATNGSQTVLVERSASKHSRATQSYGFPLPLLGLTALAGVVLAANN